MPQTSYLKTAITAALEAGKAILDIYHSNDLDVHLKEDNSPLTKADVAAHHVIMSHLKTTNIPVLSEEGKSIPYSERKDWKQLWIVDPIDGTKEFIKRNGEFTINIALIEDQRPVLGVIFVPVSGDLYFSRLDGGQARLRETTDGQARLRKAARLYKSFGQADRQGGSYKVNVTLNNFDIEALISQGIKLPVERKHQMFTILKSRSHGSEDTARYIETLRQKYGTIEEKAVGSSLKFCLIAEGQADCYPKFGPTMEWDTAAGQAICEQAGVEVIAVETQKNILYNRQDLLNSSFLVQKQKPI